MKACGSKKTISGDEQAGLMHEAEEDLREGLMCQSTLAQR